MFKGSWERNSTIANSTTGRGGGGSLHFRCVGERGSAMLVPQVPPGAGLRVTLPPVAVFSGPQSTVPGT